MSHCDRVQNLFSMILENEASLEDARFFDAHLAACSGCREDFEALKFATETLHHIPIIEPAADFEDQVMARIRTAPAPDDRESVVPVELGGERRWWQGWVPRFALAGVATAAALLIGSSYIGRLAPGAGPAIRQTPAPAVAGRTNPAPREEVTDLRQLFPDLPAEITAASQSLDGQNNYVLDKMVIRRGNRPGAVTVVSPADAETGGQVYVTF
jgi:anti-sigma factor RsiW